MCNLHAHATLLLRRCQVFTASNGSIYIIGYYCSSITRVQDPISFCHVLATWTIAPRSYHVHSASVRSLQILHYMTRVALPSSVAVLAAASHDDKIEASK